MDLLGHEMTIIAAAIICTLRPVVGFASDLNAQDRYGNLIKTRERHGDETTVRDRYGSITRT